jgi:hypothetical protein
VVLHGITAPDQDPLRIRFFKNLEDVLSERGIDYKTEWREKGKAWYCGTLEEDGKKTKQPMDVFEIRQYISDIGLTEMNKRTQLITSKQVNAQLVVMLISFRNHFSSATFSLFDCVKNRAFAGSITSFSFFQ